MIYRKGNLSDLKKIRLLGIKSWSEYKNALTPKNWLSLSKIIHDENTYYKLLNKAECVVCENSEKEIIGMAFLVPKGNPDHIYKENWCHLRFVSVHPDYTGKKIGQTLTKKCIQIAKKNKELTMALHTSEIMKSAQHIYTKIGFQVLKEIESSLGVRYWLYTLDL